MVPTPQRWPLVTGTAAGGGHTWEEGPQAQHKSSIVEAQLDRRIHSREEQGPEAQVEAEECFLMPI